jgi:hypothetical protein
MKLYLSVLQNIVEKTIPSRYNTAIIFFLNEFFAMSKNTLHHLKNSWHQAKTITHHTLRRPHNYLFKNFSLYRWWVRQDTERHIHYIAMFVGIILATYYIMIDGILQQINISSPNIFH